MPNDFTPSEWASAPLDISNDDVLAYLRRELPTAEFQLDDNLIGPTVLRVRLKVHAFEAGADGAELVAVPELREAWVAELVKTVRTQGITDYGLAPEMAQREEAARAEGYAQARTDLRAKLDADLDIYRDAAGFLDSGLAVAGDWLRTVLR